MKIKAINEKLSIIDRQPFAYKIVYIVKESINYLLR